MAYTIGSERERARQRAGSRRQSGPAYYTRLAGSDREQKFTLTRDPADGYGSVVGEVHVFDDTLDGQTGDVDVRGTGVHVQWRQPGFKAPIAVFHLGHGDLSGVIDMLIAANVRMIEARDGTVTSPPPVSVPQSAPTPFGGLIGNMKPAAAPSSARDRLRRRVGAAA